MGWIDGKKGWLFPPALFFAGIAVLVAVWAVMEPAALVDFFDNDGRSPVELATLPFFAAIVPMVWLKCPFEGSSRRRTILSLMVSVVAVMAIVKELDLHNWALHALYPQIVGEDGGIMASAGLVKPNGSKLTGTPFKMRVLTNGAVPLGMKALVTGYFALFFGVFAAGFVYLVQFWIDGVLKLKPSAWSWGCLCGSGVVVQIADRLPSWLGHGYGLAKGESVTRAQSLCTALEEGGELMLAAFALLTIYLGWRERRGAQERSPDRKRVLFWGRFDHGYSRNRVNIALFRELGWEVDFFDVVVSPRFGDVEAFCRGLARGPKPDLVWVPVCRQRDIMAACRWARRHGAKILFDPMISAWDKKVLEQKKWKAEEPRAKKLHALETVMMNAPDFVTWDTSCHVDFCEREFHVPREKMAPLFTGTDERVFKPEEGAPAPRKDGEFRVLYHGAYLPLHGMEYIVEAARMTEGKGIHWDLLGWGAYKAPTEALAKGISNITFLDKVPYVDVPKVIYTADVVLGVFGTTEKASRVIGNKIFEAMGCARPVINERCTGYPPEAKDCIAIKFVPPGDAAAIVKAVEEYRADWARREEYNRAAYDFFLRHLSMAEVKKQLVGILGRMGL
ncbi:MAG: glycosyltransferase [Kiritimatiellae bacterium]|nr:glycosyltransferase [Kiritimatiellia bacterium]